MPRTNLRSINLNLLPILHSLLKTQNVTRSAEQLNMSQSAVSEALGKLRLQFRDELLVKVGRGMKPTPMALSLQDELNEVMQSLEELVQTEQFEPSELERRFLIATADAVMLALTESLVNILDREAPGVSIHYVDVKYDMTRGLTAGDLDFVIVPGGMIDDAGLAHMPLYEDRFVCIARSGHPDIKPGLSRAEYDNLSHIAFRADYRNHETVETSLVGKNQKDIVRLPSFMLLPAMVERSDAVAMMQNRAAEHFVERYDIQIVDPPFKAPVVTHCAYWGRIHDADPAHQWFRKQLRQAALLA